MMGQMWLGYVNLTWSETDMECYRNEWFRVSNGAGMSSTWLGPYSIMIDRVAPTVTGSISSVRISYDRVSVDAVTYNHTYTVTRFVFCSF